MLTGSSYSLDDTIAAVASAPGGGLRGIVRVSGADCVRTVGQVFISHAAVNEQAIDLAGVRHPTCFAGEVRLPTPLFNVPAKLLLWPTPKSYTREPTAELHTFGSPPILQAILSALYGAGARLARPGEFTLRAFLAGRIDLPQAEAVLGVIDASDAATLRTALDQLAGNLSQPLAELRDSLLDLLAHLEAGLDFADEDIEFISQAELERQLVTAARSVEEIEARMQSRGTSSDLPKVVLVGPPNAGKSSLFNALLATDAALVSPQAGTTRDYLSRVVRLEGIECLLVDTAGVEEQPHDAIQAKAQEFSRQMLEQADVVVVCEERANDWRPTSQETRPSIIRIASKCDLYGSSLPANVIATSARTRLGLDDLCRAIVAALSSSHQGDMVPATAARCRASLRGAAVALHQALAALAQGGGEELVAAELRLALDELGQVLGAVYTDDILDRVFGRFCIGK